MKPTVAARTGQILIAGGLIVIIAGGLARNLARGTSFGLVVIALALTLMLAGLILWGQARARTARRASVARACPGAQLWEGWMGGGFRAGLRTEGVGERGGFSGQASVTLAVQDGGLQIWRSRLSGPVVALAWPDVDAILAGSAAAQNATTRPAIIIRTRRGALLPVILAQKPSGSLAPASAQQTMQAVHRLAGMLGQHRG